MLMRSGGVDRTNQFPQGIFPENMYPGGDADLLVGRMVPEGDITQIANQHIVLHGWVYEFSRLKESRRDMYKHLLRFAGTDASAKITHPQRNDTLMSLYLEHPELIVGKITDEYINQKLTTGELARHTDPSNAWVSVGKYVYNVTGIARYPECHEVAFPPEILGRAIDDDQERARWLATVHEFRRIGVLVEGPPSETPLPERPRKDETIGELRERVYQGSQQGPEDFAWAEYRAAHWPGCVLDDEGYNEGEDDAMDIDG
ncbi:hypothetical protein GGR53DRAFT_208511 [Hypoxylon sp. FL1150]|nr:hypothetical protein GGR53DRAFT_208511 [Hypoxylon sp. FL1150]